MDTIAERQLLVFIQPSNGYPEAVLVETDEFSINEDFVQVGDAILRDGQLLRDGSEPESVEYPQQTFTRWYGYTATFLAVRSSRGTEMAFGTDVDRLRDVPARAIYCLDLSARLW